MYECSVVSTDSRFLKCFGQLFPSLLFTFYVSTSGVTRSVASISNLMPWIYTQHGKNNQSNPSSISEESFANIAGSYTTEVLR